MDKPFMISDECLDELFVKEVASVTRIVEQMPENDMLISTCTRWLNVFQQASINEKLSRNCMLLLLHKQLKDEGTVSHPFTDAHSWQKDLITLHKMSITKQKPNISTDDDEHEGFFSFEYSSDSVRSFEAGGGDNNDQMRLNDVNNQLIKQNSALKSEMQSLQAEKLRLLQCTQNCEANMQMMRNNDQMYSKESNFMKDIFECSAITALELLAKSESTFNARPEYFATLLNVLCEDEKDRSLLQKLDTEFGQLLHFYISHSKRSALEQEINKQFDVIRARQRTLYKQRVLELQHPNQMRCLSNKAMQYFCVLRKVFLETFQGDNEECEAVLQFINQQYEELSQD